MTTTPTEDVLRAAADLRERTDDVLPYWESVLAAAWASTSFTVFATEAVRHEPDLLHDRLQRVSAEELRTGALTRVLAKLQKGHVLGLDSRCVLLDGGQAHLPLMDFRMLPRIGDIDKIRIAARAIGQNRGAILRSGRSYHYYGFDPLSRDEWVRFCAQSLLLSPLTDSRLIAHRLLAGGASLRLTPSPEKPHVPKVVATL